MRRTYLDGQLSVPERASPGSPRRALLFERRELLAELRALDEEATRWFEDVRAVRARLDEVEHQLWEHAFWTRRDRSPAPEHPPFPSAAVEPLTPIGGSELTELVARLLATHEELTVEQIAVALRLRHRAASPKAIGDALGRMARSGRAERIGRARYRSVTPRS